MELTRADRRLLAVSGGSLFFPNAANEKDGCAATASYAENLAERQLSESLSGSIQHGAAARGRLELRPLLTEADIF